MDFADNVTAKALIHQSPLSDSADVPPGTNGHVEDRADGLLWVDFGDPYGVVACDSDEVE